jgi:hypothetical protein
MRNSVIIRIACMPLLLIAAYACDSSPNETTAAHAPAPAAHEHPTRRTGDVPLPPLWSRDGLAAQPRLDELVQRIPPDLGWEPATTPWHAARRDAPEELQTVGAESPGDLLYRLAVAWDWAASLGRDVWEHTLRIHQADDEHAVGAVLAWGLQDDALAGSDLRVQMRREGAAWRIIAIEERHHCARGVTGDGLCR